jgi:Fe2+ transport system protein B
MLLSDLKDGKAGVTVNVRGKGAFRKRIIEMGFVRGKFVLELPPYRIPTLRATIRHMWSRTSQYLQK